VVLRAVLLGSALEHEPAVVRSGGEPARAGRRAELVGAQGQLVGLPVVGELVAVLKDEGGVEVVVGALERACGEELLHPGEARLVARDDVGMQRAVAVGLVGLEDRAQLVVCLHRVAPSTG
jgi:hypothetical protein